MKTTSINPKAELLLGAGLDVLHQESLEWLDTIMFWKDEAKFFATLLSGKDSITSEYVNVLKNLDKIHENLGHYLTDDIVAHEKYLSRIIKNDQGVADDNYRDQHKKLKERMDLFAQSFVDFKRMVFGYVKKL